MFGNVHYAKLLSKLKKDDITKHGSGNPGTMNMLRTHGVLYGISTLTLDALKGALPTLAGYYVLGGASAGMIAINAMYVAGLSAVLGHIFPICNKFKGGKGVATSFGMFTVISPLISFVLFAIALAVLIVVKIGSLTSMVYIIGFTLYITITNFTTSYILPLLILYIITILIIYSHRNNMKKLVKGQENKFDFKQTIQKDKQTIQNAKQAIKDKLNKK